MKIVMKQVEEKEGVGGKRKKVPVWKHKSELYYFI